MAELRWLLLLLGIGVIAAVYLYTRYKPQIESKLRSIEVRKEPRLDVTALTNSPDLPDAGGEATEPEIGAGSAREPKSAELKMVVAIRLMAKDSKGLPAEQLILRLRELGLRHGQFGIFHRYRDADDEASETVFSVASLVEPGSFDLTRIKIDHYPGISIFMMLPGPDSSVTMFDEMMDFARQLVKYLDGYLLDEQGGTLSIQRERYIREEVIQFEHRGADSPSE